METNDMNVVFLITGSS